MHWLSTVSAPASCFFDEDFACFRDGFVPPLRSFEVIDFLKAFSALADGDSKVGSKF